MVRIFKDKDKTRQRGHSRILTRPTSVVGSITMNSIPLVTLFWLLLLASCGYALWRGRKYERMAALVFIAATVSSILWESPVQHRYVGIELTDLIVDSGVLVALIAIALLSDRFWPLWAAGLQLVDSLSHVMKAVDAGMIAKAYGTAERFWSFPILAVLSPAHGEVASDCFVRGACNRQFDWRESPPHLQLHVPQALAPASFKPEPSSALGAACG